MTDLSSLLRNMEAFAEQNHVPIIKPQARSIFLEIVRKHRPHACLELGTAIGYSALLTLSQAAEDAEITTIELMEKRFCTAKQFFAQSPYAESDRIHPVLGDADMVLQALKEKKRTFDFIFIDAAKGQYPEYFRVASHLLTKDGFILADNVWFRGWVLGHQDMADRGTERRLPNGEGRPPKRMRTIVRRLQEYLQLANQPPFHTVIFERGDGLALTMRQTMEKE